jgi:hypothetical protein
MQYNTAQLVVLCPSYAGIMYNTVQVVVGAWGWTWGPGPVWKVGRVEEGGDKFE